MVPGRIAFVLEAIGPDVRQRVVDLVFLTARTARRTRGPAEDGFEARFVPLSDLPGLVLRPPIAGHLRNLHSRVPVRTAAYLGNCGGRTARPVARTWCR